MLRNVTKRILKGIKSVIRPILYFSMKGVDYFSSICTRERKYIRKEIIVSLSENSSEKLCIFSHFDRNHLIDEYVIYYLQELHKLGCDIVFVSGSEQLEIKEIEKISALCKRIIIKQNIGLDFCAWKLGLVQMPNYDRYKQIVFANDSVYGPLFDLGHLFKVMAERQFDLWGITDNFQKHYHLQSYFLVFNQEGIKNEFFRRFWKQVKFFKSKQVIINQYEIGLTQQAIKAGLRLGVFCNYNYVINFVSREHPVFYNDVISKNSPVVNPTLFLWKFLIQKCGCPFLKVHLLRDDHGRVKINDWKEVLEQATNYDTHLILNHLERMRSYQALSSR